MFKSQNNIFYLPFKPSGGDRAGYAWKSHALEMLLHRFLGAPPVANLYNAILIDICFFARLSKSKFVFEMAICEAKNYALT